jgi:hypothetical protein
VLQFDFQFLNDVFSLCFAGNGNSFNPDIPAEAFGARGSYVSSYQKVKLTSEGKCLTTPGRRELVDDTPSKPLTDKASVCYQTELELSAFASVGSDVQDSVQDSQKLIIKFADVVAAEGEDFYAHVLASTFSFVQSHLVYYCRPIQENFSKIEIVARVVLQSVSEDQIVIEAKPSSEIQLGLCSDLQATVQAGYRFCEKFCCSNASRTRHD